MAIQVVETWDSRKMGLELEGSSEIIQYIITGTTDDLDAYNAALAVLPATFNGLTFRSLEITPLGGPVWSGTANYGVSQVGPQSPAQGGVSPPPPSPPAPADTAALTDADGVSFSTVGGTSRITTSLATPYKGLYDTGLSFAPTFHRTIGADGEGCDVVTGQLRMTIKRNFPSLTMGYVKTLASLTGTVNSGTWRNFIDSACLFLGAQGEYRGPGGWAVSFEFDVAPAVSLYMEDGTTTVKDDSDGTTPIVAPPHHYVWTLFRKAESNGHVTEEPVSVYVEQVYRKTNFDSLGI